MAEGKSRTLKLSILGETKQLVDSLGAGKKSVQSFEDKLLDFSKKSALAFAAAATAAAAYATKLVVDGVQSAIADEAAQLRLANALKNATGATNAQIKATEDYISKTAVSVGITDDDLRPAFQRLAVATGNVTESQDLLNLAIDVSRGSNKDLGSVVEALSKAYGGQDTALARLGVGITATQAKTMSFKEEAQLLADTWGGSASAAADTLSVKLEIMRIRFDEAKEKLGTALLPILTRFAEYLLQTAVPAIEAFVDGLVGDKSMTGSFTKAQESAFKFGEQTKSVIKALVSLKDEAIIVGGVLVTLFTASAIVGGISTIVTAIKTLIQAYNALKVSAAVAAVATYLAANPLAGVAAAAIIGGVLATASKQFGASDIDTSFGVSGSNFEYGAGNPMSGSSGGFSGVPSGGGFTGGGFTGGAAGSAGASAAIAAATSLTDLKDKLLNVSDKIADTTFLLASGAISSKTAQKQLDGLQKQMNVLEKQANTLLAAEESMNSTFRGGGSLDAQRDRRISTPFDEPGTTNITVNMGIVGDPESAKRAIIDLQNEGFYRGTGGANLLVGRDR